MTLTIPVVMMASVSAGGNFKTKHEGDPIHTWVMVQGYSKSFENKISISEGPCNDVQHMYSILVLLPHVQRLSRCRSNYHSNTCLLTQVLLKWSQNMIDLGVAPLKVPDVQGRGRAATAGGIPVPRTATGWGNLLGCIFHIASN